MKNTSQKTVSQVLQDLGDRYEELQRLKKVDAIVQAHPEWAEQEPRLKQLLRSVA